MLCKLGGICCFFTRKITSILDCSAHLINLLVRIYIFDVFFSSGLTKIKDFQTTIYLFEHEYKSLWLPLPPPVQKNLGWDIPAIPIEFAAYSGVAFELVIPFFLLLGLGGRLPALFLFLFNYIAAVSYPFLWTNSGAVGLMFHYFWGALLLMLTMYGCGKISADNFIKEKLCKDINKF